MSEIRANTVSNAAGTGPATLTGQYASKVWVNFNGKGTVAIRDSQNVSSLTDNTTGDYTVSYTSNMLDANHSFSINGISANYSVRGGAYLGTKVDDLLNTNTASFYSSSSHTIDCAYGAYSAGNASALDADTVCLQTFGDLA